jgi:hypothetical protein
MSLSFKLAPMSLALRVLTWLLMPLPVVFLAAGLTMPAPASVVMLASGVFIVFIYASIWFAFRPTRFELDGQKLRIVWPIRLREIDRADIESARVITSEELRREYGYGMRIGAGGLWGGFGLLQTGRETFSMWISRTDRFVIVKLRGARPLLVTPSLPERFVQILSAAHS